MKLNVKICKLPVLNELNDFMTRSNNNLNNFD